jgi:hypothetical protein
MPCTVSLILAAAAAAAALLLLQGGKTIKGIIAASGAADIVINNSGSIQVSSTYECCGASMLLCMCALCHVECFYQRITVQRTPLPHTRNRLTLPLTLQ